MPKTHFISWYILPWNSPSFYPLPPSTSRPLPLSPPPPLSSQDQLLSHIRRVTCMQSYRTSHRITKMAKNLPKMIRLRLCIWIQVSLFKLSDEQNSNICLTRPQFGPAWQHMGQSQVCDETGCLAVRFYCARRHKSSDTNIRGHKPIWIKSRRFISHISHSATQTNPWFSGRLSRVLQKQVSLVFIRL